MPIQFASYLTPRTGNTYALLDDKYIKGGYRVVADVTARNSIDASCKKSGMLVHTLDDGKIWKLGGDLVTWVEYTVGGGTNGSKWLSGSGVPSVGAGNVDDFYINTLNGDYYKKTNSTTWTVQGSLKGNTGATGPAGATGSQGPQGPQGLTGPAGPAGSGQSAYQLAVSLGFVGTEAQWLSSLVGPQGVAGAQGPQGAQGPAGPIGLTGPQGPSGSVTAGSVVAGTFGYNNTYPNQSSFPSASSLAGTVVIDGSNGSAFYSNGTNWVAIGAATNIPYDIALNIFGKLDVANKLLSAFVATRNITISSQTSSLAVESKIPSSSNVSLILKHNSIQIGTVSFTSGSTNGTLTIPSTVNLVPGSLLELYNSATPDTALENVMLTITANLS